MSSEHSANDDVVVRLTHVSKTFKLPHEKNSSVKGAVVNVFRSKRTYEQQHVLKDVSFEIKRGEFFGIVGRNGSGKSTLLKLLAGIYTPTLGTVEIHGKLTPFIELGVGFNPELTGRENVYLNGALLGFNRKEMQAMYDDIVEFAELKPFMDQKLKNYSSGMQVRLAFSIAIRAKSDILLIDEVLAVGDAAFQAKCLEYFTTLKKQGRTVVFISHDMESVRRFCTRALLIDKGEIVVSGEPQKAIDEYLRIMSNVSTTNKNPFGMDSGVKVHENKIEIIRVWTEDQAGKKTDRFDKHEPYTVCVNFKALDVVDDPVPGVVLRNHDGLRVTASNTVWAGKHVGSLEKNQERTVKFTFPNLLEQGYYYVSANVVSADLEHFYAWANDAAELYSKHDFLTGGVINPNYEVTVHE